MKKLLILSMLFLVVLAGSAAAALTITPTSVDMGTVAADSATDGTATKQSAFSLQNSDASAVTVAYTLGAAAGQNLPTTITLDTAGTTPTSIPGSNAPTPVTLKINVARGTAAGTYTGTLTATDAASSTNKATTTVTVVVSSTHNVVVDPTGAVVVAVDYSTLRERETTLNTTKSVTIKNTGSFSEQVTLAFTAAKTGVTGTLSAADSSFTLAAGASKTVTLNVGVPLLASGVSKIGALDIKFNGAQTTNSVDINADVKPMIEFADIDVQVGEEDDKNLKAGDSIDSEAKPEDKVTFTFRVDNLLDQDYRFGDFEDVEINLQIDDRDFGDGIDEDSDNFDLDAGEDKEDIDISFDVPEDAEDGDYTVDLVLSGVLKETGVRHQVTAKLTLEVKLENDDLQITTLEPNPLTLQCSRDATISFRVKNQGTNDQDDVVINVDSSALGINERFSGIELDELGGSDDDIRKEFRVTLNDRFAAGTYEYEVRAFIDGDKLMDSERGTVRVENCAGSVPTSSDINGGTTVVVQPPVTPPTTPTAPSTPTGAVTGDVDDFVDSVEVPFTQSPYFLVLLVLANVVVLGLIVFIIVKVAVR